MATIRRYRTPVSRHRRNLRRRAGVFIFSLITVVIAGFATISWLSYITHTQRAAAHDRARLHAFYAAEAGIEEVINYFNRPEDFAGNDPAAYDEALATSPYPEPYPGAPTTFTLFEPYIVAVQEDADGNIIYDENGEPTITKSTFMMDLDDGYSSKIPTCRLPIDARLTFTDASGANRAWVTDLILVNPNEIPVAENKPPADDYVFAKVISRAETPEGVAVAVEVLLRENPLHRLSSPAAIVSQTSTLFSGNFNVHWGQVWSLGDIPLPSNWNSSGASKIPTELEDPWVYIKTGGVLKNNTNTTYANGANSTGYTATPITSGATNYEIPYLDSVLIKGNNGKSPFDNYENLLQHQTELEFPEYNYEQLKSFFIAFGLPYYYTDNNGLIYGKEDDPSSNNYGQYVGKTFEDWFAIDPSDSDYWDPTDAYVFIDSVPVDDQGNVNPNTNGAVIDSQYYPRNPETTGRMSTINENGNGIHTRGLFFVANHVDFGGQGNPPQASAILDRDGDPYVISPPDEQGNHDDPTNNTRISHNGIFYAWGAIDIGGNRSYYGSLYTKTGFTGTGRPEVWYNYRLRDGLWDNANQSLVLRTSWRVRTEALPVVL